MSDVIDVLKIYYYCDYGLYYIKNVDAHIEDLPSCVDVNVTNNEDAAEIIYTISNKCCEAGVVGFTIPEPTVEIEERKTGKTFILCDESSSSGEQCIVNVCLPTLCESEFEYHRMAPDMYGNEPELGDCADYEIGKDERIDILELFFWDNDKPVEFLTIDPLEELLPSCMHVDYENLGSSGHITYTITRDCCEIGSLEIAIPEPLVVLRDKNTGRIFKLCGASSSAAPEPKHSSPEPHVTSSGGKPSPGAGSSSSSCGGPLVCIPEVCDSPYVTWSSYESKEGIIPNPGECVHYDPYVDIFSVEFDVRGLADASILSIDPHYPSEHVSAWIDYSSDKRWAKVTYYLEESIPCDAIVELHQPTAECIDYTTGEKFNPCDISSPAVSSTTSSAASVESSKIGSSNSSPSSSSGPCLAKVCMPTVCNSKYVLVIPSPSQQGKTLPGPGECGYYDITEGAGEGDKVLVCSIIVGGIDNVYVAQADAGKILPGSGLTVERIVDKRTVTLNYYIRTNLKLDCDSEFIIADPTIKIMKDGQVIDHCESEDSSDSGSSEDLCERIPIKIDEAPGPRKGSWVELISYKSFFKPDEYYDDTVAIFKIHYSIGCCYKTIDFPPAVTSFIYPIIEKTGQKNPGCDEDSREYTVSVRIKYDPDTADKKEIQKLCTEGKIVIPYPTWSSSCIECDAISFEYGDVPSEKKGSTIEAGELAGQFDPKEKTSGDIGIFIIKTSIGCCIDESSISLPIVSSFIHYTITPGGVVDPTCGTRTSYIITVSLDYDPETVDKEEISDFCSDGKIVLPYPSWKTSCDTPPGPGPIPPGPGEESSKGRKASSESNSQSRQQSSKRDSDESQSLSSPESPSSSNSEPEESSAGSTTCKHPIKVKVNFSAYQKNLNGRMFMFKHTVNGILCEEDPASGDSSAGGDSKASGGGGESGKENTARVAGGDSLFFSGVLDPFNVKYRVIGDASPKSFNGEGRALIDNSSINPSPYIGKAEMEITSSDTPTPFSEGVIIGLPLRVELKSARLKDNPPKELTVHAILDVGYCFKVETNTRVFWYDQYGTKHGGGAWTKCPDETQKVYSDTSVLHTGAGILGMFVDFCYDLPSVTDTFVYLYSRYAGPYYGEETTESEPPTVLNVHNLQNYNDIIDFNIDVYLRQIVPTSSESSSPPIPKKRIHIIGVIKEYEKCADGQRYIGDIPITGDVYAESYTGVDQTEWVFRGRLDDFSVSTATEKLTCTGSFDMDGLSTTDLRYTIDTDAHKTFSGGIVEGPELIVRTTNKEAGENPPQNLDVTGDAYITILLEVLTCTRVHYTDLKGEEHIVKQLYDCESSSVLSSEALVRTGTWLASILVDFNYELPDPSKQWNYDYIIYTGSNGTSSTLDIKTEQPPPVFLTTPLDDINQQFRFKIDIYLNQVPRKIDLSGPVDEFITNNVGFRYWAGEIPLSGAVYEQYKTEDNKWVFKGTLSDFSVATDRIKITGDGPVDDFYRVSLSDNRYYMDIEQPTGYTDGIITGPSVTIWTYDREAGENPPATLALKGWFYIDVILTIVTCTRVHYTDCDGSTHILGPYECETQQVKYSKTVIHNWRDSGELIINFKYNLPDTENQWDYKYSHFEYSNGKVTDTGRIDSKPPVELVLDIDDIVKPFDFTIDVYLKQVCD